MIAPYVSPAARFEVHVPPPVDGSTRARAGRLSLTHGDVVVELIMGRPLGEPRTRQAARYELEWEGVKNEMGEDLFSLRLAPELCGKLQYRIRVYPCHELLTHPFEAGLMIWL